MSGLFTAGSLQSQPLIPAGHRAGVLKMANQQGKLAELSLPPPSADVTGVQGPCPGRKSAEGPTAFRWPPAREAGGAEPRPEKAGPGPEGGFSRVHTRKRGRVSAQSRWRRSHRRSRHLLLSHAGKWSRRTAPRRPAASGLLLGCTAFGSDVPLQGPGRGRNCRPSSCPSHLAPRPPPQLLRPSRKSDPQKNFIWESGFSMWKLLAIKRLQA